MRLSTISAGLVTLAVAGAARAAPLPLAPQQLELCRLHYRYINDTGAYNRAQATMNSIQKASAPNPPQPLPYAVKFAQDVGASGDFKDWTGFVNFTADPTDRTVWLNINFACPPATNPANAGVKYPPPGEIGSVRNQGGPAISGWQKYLAGNGYDGIPLDGKMAAGLGQIPNDGRPHYVRFSGHLLYLPSVAGPKALPTYAKPDAEPNPFNVIDMLLVFRITSLTTFH